MSKQVLYVVAFSFTTLISSNFKLEAETLSSPSPQIFLLSSNYVTRLDSPRVVSVAAVYGKLDVSSTCQEGASHPTYAAMSVSQRLAIRDCIRSRDGSVDLKNSRLLGYSGSDKTFAQRIVLGSKFEWDFGDSSGRHNQVTGYNAAHIYENHSSSRITFTISLKVTNPAGMSRTVTTNVSVDPDGRKNYYIRPDGNDSNSGTSDASAWKTTAKVFSQLESGNLCNNVGIYFKRSTSTYSLSNTLNMCGNNNVVGAYGDASLPRPKIRTQFSSPYKFALSSNGNERNTFQDLDVAGSSGTTRPYIFQPSNRLNGIRRNIFTYADYVINNTSYADGIIVEDNGDVLADKTPAPIDVSEYFAYPSGRDWAFYGNHIKMGGYSSLFRGCSFPNERISLSFNDFEHTGYLYKNMALRTFRYTTVVGNKSTTGTIEVGPHCEGSTNWPDEVSRNLVFDSNKFTNSKLWIKKGVEGIRVSNNVFRSMSTGTLPSPIQIAIDGPAEEAPGPTMIQLINNTHINERSDGNLLYMFDPQMNAIDFGNNI
jgi:hypothetical protein